MVVDDSVSIDQDIFDLEAYEGPTGSESPTRSRSTPMRSRPRWSGSRPCHAGSGARVSETTLEQDEDDYETAEQDLEPDPDPEE